MIDGLGRPRSALVVGGTSEIALATVSALCGQARCRVVLAGRNLSSLEQAARRLPGARATPAVFDPDEDGSVGRLVGECFGQLGGLDMVLVALGSLGDQGRDEHDPVAVAGSIRANFSLPAQASVAAADHLRAQGHGVLVVLSSVAARPVRRTNFVYGSAKAGLDGFCLGLADSLDGSGARLLLVRPGFVRTRMTAGRRPAPLACGPEEVAEAVRQGLIQRRRVVWVPPAMRWVSAGLSLLPRPALGRLPV